MDYIAHTSKTGKMQTIKDHLLQTAALSQEYAIDELKPICYIIGLYHDVGKYQPGFQDRVRGAEVRIEHSICGARVIRDTSPDQNPLKQLAELCIAGHHTGIPNCGSIAEAASLKYRLDNGECEDYSTYKSEIGVPVIPDAAVFNNYLIHGNDSGDVSECINRYAFVTRYCHSCLTDADAIDTMKFEGHDKSLALSSNFLLCKEYLDKKISRFKVETKIQAARSELGKQALKNLDESEIFLMNMPTGSGKTLASMQCALELAIRNNLQRIIYVIPYNSIIDQTAEVFEKTFQEAGNIVRHQSSFSYEDMDGVDKEYVYSVQRACENWDADIIITTSVQFFESLYGNKSNKLRKVHNMAEAVIVFDEAHLMPREYLQPCLSGIGYIARLLHSKILFLTATMPNYSKLLHTYALPDLRVKDLISDKSCFHYFQKTEFVNLRRISTVDLIRRVSKSPACLVVMNTRDGARKVYSLCSGRKFHLSTYMVGIDRENTINKIHQALDELYEEYHDLSLVPPEKRIVVISTSLIEAGVDLDFVDAYREISGLDNVLQTGGRCNREGKRSGGRVCMFKLNENHIPLQVNQCITQGIFKEFDDVSSPEAIETYYERFLFTEKEKFGMHAVSSHCNSLDSIDFKTYSENFNIIDDCKTVSVAVVRDTYSAGILEKLKETHEINPRTIQKYCCTIYTKEFDKLMKQGVLDDYGSGIHFLTDSDYYDLEMGIQFIK